MAIILKEKAHRNAAVGTLRDAPTRWVRVTSDRVAWRNRRESTRGGVELPLLRLTRPER
jgi:hypothetical protein